MSREETDQNKNADDNKEGSFGLGYSGNNTPFFVSRVKPEMDDIKPEFWLECLTCGESFTNRDEIDLHATSCQIIEDGVMTTSEVARSDSGEDTVEMSRTRLSFPNNESILSGLELDREGNNVVHNFSIECWKTTTENVTTPSHAPCQTSYEIENIDGKVLGVAVDDIQVAAGIPLRPKENASSSTEKIVGVKLSRKLSWIPCHSCGTFLPNQAKLEYHFACRHYSPKIFDDTFDDRNQAGEEKETEESDVQFVMEEDILIQSDVRMTRWCECETCHHFVFSKDDHLCRSNPKGQEYLRSLEEDENEDLIGASKYGVSKDELIRETEDADQSSILSKSRPGQGQTTQKSQKTNASCFNRKTRGKRGISGVQKEACHTITRKSERLRKRLRLPEKGQISIGLVEQESDSETMHPSSFNRKSRGKQVLISKQNEGDSKKDDTDLVEKRSSRRCKKIRELRRERKLCSDSSTWIKVKSRESRTRKSNKGVNKLSSKNGNEMYSPASSGTRPNEKYKHQCTECFKWFQGKFDLQRHMRSHTGEKPFRCDICRRQFSQKMHLSRHQRVHDGTQPFECDICRQKFSQKTHLERHRKLHTRVLPLKCRHCPMTFGHQRYLIPHEKRHIQM